MTQPKPNTMDDLRGEIADAIMQPWFDQTFSGSGMMGDPPVTTIKVKDEQINRLEALITAKLNEVDRAAREDQIMLDFLSLAVELDVDESILIDWRESQLASLKGGDV